jgi:nucleoid-associated protein YgaU
MEVNMAEEKDVTIAGGANISKPSTENAHFDNDINELKKEMRDMQAAKAAMIKHVWTSDDTYASLAQKYYGAFTEPYWRLIYEHNKAIIGSHPNAIRVGLEIEIPPLPEELKKK